MIALLISGPPRTKKNSSRVLRFGKFNKVVPSVAFIEWQDEAIDQLHGQFSGPAIDAPVSVTATIYREANRGDLIGYMQAIADVLEKAGVLVNDSQIVSWDGTRMGKDAARPRVEMKIEEIPALLDGPARFRARVKAA